MITQFKITNIKGFGDTDNTLDVELDSSRINIVVAPNGFGKTSLTTAFKSVQTNNRRLIVEDINKYKKDKELQSSFQIVEDGHTYISNQTTNEIATNFNCQVISSLLFADTTSKKFGAFTHTNAYLNINTVELCKVKSKPEQFYKVTDIRGVFGIKGKVLGNISSYLENVNFMTELTNYYDVFQKFDASIRSNMITEIENYANAQTVSNESIRNTVDLSKLKSDEYYNRFRNYLSSFVSCFTDWDIFSIFYQLRYLYKNKREKLRQQIEALEYNHFRDKLDQNLKDFNSSWKENLKSEVHDAMLQVKFPHADELSNGQRDVMSFVVQLMNVRSKLKETKKNIVVIDEIFDYMDDANLITAQYYLTQYLKLNKGNLYIIILSHLDPTYFKSYVFSKKTINVCYLNRQALSLSNEMKAFLSFRNTLNRKEADDNALYKDISNYFFHYNPAQTDLTTRIHSHISNLQTNWFKDNNLKVYILSELNKYLSGATSDDPYSVCLAIRLRVEKVAYEKLKTQEERDEFLKINKTKDKLQYVEDCGLLIPDSYYVMGSIYNDAEHLVEPSKDKNCIYKLYHRVIKKIVVNFFEYDGENPIEISKL